MRESRKERFATLLEPVHEAATRYCLRLCTTREDAEDLYHDAVLAAWRGIGGLKDERLFKPWFFRIVTNVFRNRERRRKWRRWVPWPGASDDNDIEDVASHAVDPRDTLTARRLLDRAMRVLSPEERTLIVLYEIERYTIGEIATIQQMREGTIKSKLSRARARMRQVLMDETGDVATVVPNHREVGYALRPNQATSE